MVRLTWNECIRVGFVLAVWISISNVPFPLPLTVLKTFYTNSSFIKHFFITKLRFISWFFAYTTWSSFRQSSYHELKLNQSLHTQANNELLVRILKQLRDYLLIFVPTRSCNFCLNSITEVEFWVLRFSLHRFPSCLALVFFAISLLFLCFFISVYSSCSYALTPATVCDS